jgi:hypothetical protein
MDDMAEILGRRIKCKSVRVAPYKVKDSDKYLFTGSLRCKGASTSENTELTSEANVSCRSRTRRMLIIEDLESNSAAVDSTSDTAEVENSNQVLFIKMFCIMSEIFSQ